MELRVIKAAPLTPWYSLKLPWKLSGDRMFISKETEVNETVRICHNSIMCFPHFWDMDGLKRALNMMNDSSGDVTLASRKVIGYRTGLLQRWREIPGESVSIPLRRGMRIRVKVLNVFRDMPPCTVKFVIKVC